MQLGGGGVPRGFWCINFSGIIDCFFETVSSFIFQLINLTK